VGAGIAAWVPGTAAHSWQAVAAGGTSIGFKGADLAARALSSPPSNSTRTRRCAMRRAPSSNSVAATTSNTRRCSVIVAPPLDYRK
jgi:aminobenzoyl-glutamate utilization protein B